MGKNKYEVILREAARLISLNGYAGTSFQEIANNVGIHKSTLFHYFPNKESLLLRILERSIDDVYGNLDRITKDGGLTPEEKLRKAIENHLGLLVRYCDNVNVYLHEFRNLSPRNQRMYLQKRKKYEEAFKKIILDMKEIGYFDGLDGTIVTFGILGMLNWTTKWFRNDKTMGTGDLTEVFSGMVTQKRCTRTGGSDVH